MLVLTGLGFLVRGLTGHAHHEYDHAQPLARRLATIAVPFGVAAAPDLAIAGGAGGVLLVFTAPSMGRFVGLTVLATAAGYQFQSAWLEEHATTITAAVLIVSGVVAYVGL